MNFNVNKIIEQSQCVGCGLCSNVCPKNAIKMIKQATGLFPFVDNKKCINCGVCYNKCLQKNNFNINKQYNKIFVHSNKLFFDNCTSSGFCTQLADFLMRLGYSIYGAYYNGTDVRIGNITNDNLRMFSGSKYIKSYYGDVFNEIKSRLINNEKVAAFGLPCQIEALIYYLKDYISDKNFVSVALFCGGGIPQSVYESYLRLLCRNHYTDIMFINFRDKKYLPYQYSTSILSHGRKKYLNGLLGSFTFLMSLGYIEKGCHQCKRNGCFKADIVVGDSHRDGSNKINESIIFYNLRKEKFLLEFLNKREFNIYKSDNKPVYKSNNFLYNNDYDLAMETLSRDYKIGFKKYCLTKFNLKRKILIYSPYFIKQLYSKLINKK